MTQIRHHPARVIVKPFPGTDAVERKGHHHSEPLLASQSAQGGLQVVTQARGQAIEAFLEAELGQKTGAIELIEQSLQTMSGIASPQR